jgi:hypothetical protein
MNVTAEQELAVQNGHTVTVVVAGRPCVLLRKDIYDRGEALDYSHVDDPRKWICSRRRPRTCWQEMVLTNETIHEA